MHMPSLTLAQANKIVETALAKAREMKIKPLAVAVLDQSGHVKSLQREDGASMHPVAWTLTPLDDSAEAKIRALIKKAVA